MTEPERVPLWRRIIAVATTCLGAGYLVMVAIEWARPASNLPVDEFFPHVLLLSIVLLALGTWMNNRFD